MSILDALDRPIAFHRVFVGLTDSVNAALMLSQAVYWTKRTSDASGWFYKTQDDWMEETGLTRFEQETARKVLRKRGFLEEKRVGIPAKLHYRVQVEILQTRMLESSNLDCCNPADRSAGIPQSLIAETTTETTAEIKKREMRSSVKAIFIYYIEQTGKNPKLYTLTDKRVEKGILRLQDCLKKTDGDLAKAEDLMRMCIDALVESEFHMGKNDKGQQYVDWIDHLFKNTEKLEWWMNR